MTRFSFELSFISGKQLLVETLRKRLGNQEKVRTSWETRENTKKKIQKTEYQARDTKRATAFMEQKTDNKSGDGGGNRVLTLADVFFFKNKKRVLRRKIVHNITSFASVHQTFRLLLTCKEMLSAEEKIFQFYPPPTVSDMTKGDGLKMYHLMVRTPNSRWLEWLATSQVKELKLPTSVTNEEMSIIFVRDGRFSELQSLKLWGCYNITHASLANVVRRCPNLQSLDLGDCYHINDASVLVVARGCSNLQSLDLRWCQNITDASLGEVARRCSNLQSLNLKGITTSPTPVCLK